MKVYTNKEDIRKAIAKFKSDGKHLGLVPTMGALHEGHLDLVKKACKENDKVAVTIFVNPTQFNNAEDLEKYPRTLDTDLKALEALDTDNIMVYAPEVDDIYEGQTTSESFDFDGLEHEMEGKFRPGHFNGVGTVVKHLFKIIEPERAYFGEKDFQQLAIIKKMVKKEALPVKVIACPIFREPSGLAMSSRNLRLTPEHKKAAPFIYKTLKTVRSKFGTESAQNISAWVQEEFAKQPLLELEYFVIADTKTLKPIEQIEPQKAYRAFIAVYADDIRLIDNIALN
ncbi:pantoate--beta-alanine ligase [Gaetbulibacter aestuarii]|uniref:Pantothenate synthetase n=1 Tax=Gaetbulibacter aestuarii TaxID=1502358 RepID=A0ABW7MVL4_9FLAO